MNPPAFPVPMIPMDHNGGHCDVQNRGITMLDYFATAAMQALLASQLRMSTGELVARSYDIAMEMLGERGSRP